MANKKNGANRNSANKKPQSRSARMFTDRDRLGRIAKVVAVTLIVVMVLYFCITSSAFLFG